MLLQKHHGSFIATIPSNCRITLVWNSLHFISCLLKNCEHITCHVRHKYLLQLPCPWQHCHDAVMFGSLLEYMICETDVFIRQHVDTFFKANESSGRYLPSLTSVATWRNIDKPWLLHNIWLKDMHGVLLSKQSYQETRIQKNYFDISLYFSRILLKTSYHDSCFVTCTISQSFVMLPIFREW